jgi:dihydroorotate dehydrogenase (NAD+) catalytic subunit
MKSKDLKINFAGLKLKNPVFVASGIAGFGEEYSKVFDLNILGGFITKTITLYPRAGNTPPRIVETSSGMVNSIGLENPGLEIFLKEKLPFLRSSLKVPLVVSVGGEDVKEYVKVVELLKGKKGIDAIELNISCPNVKLKSSVKKSNRAPLISQDTKLTYAVVKKARKTTKLPLIVKLSPNVTDIGKIAKSCEDAGADAVSLTNTYKALSFMTPSSIGSSRIILGGLSGPAVKPMSLRAIWEVYEKVKLPIMGVGGIKNAIDVIEHFAAGAAAVAVGSALFKEPNLVNNILSELTDYLKKKKICLKDIIGCAH